MRGKGNAESFESCSHGAGRTMSRTAAKRRFTVADHAAAAAGVECRKDEGVVDDTPMAYKDIDAVMAAAGRPGGRCAHPQAVGVREGLRAGGRLVPFFAPPPSVIAGSTRDLESFFACESAATAHQRWPSSYQFCIDPTSLHLSARRIP